MPNNSEFLDPFDDCEWLPACELLRRLGFEPPPPSAVDDFELRGRLWEMIYAMAGRRIYLYHADHLSDRELYVWLHDQWLADEVADIPPQAEWNCHVDVSESSTGKDPMIWLRYYAGEEERAEWAVECPEDAVPPHENPAHQRDRWLPEPPGIPVDTDDEDLFLSTEEVEGDSDPLGLAAADAEIRSEKRANEDRGEERTAFMGGEQPEGWQRPIDQLNRTGASILPPDELTDETISSQLWELLHRLACRGFYVLHTDHLTDRELYAELWRRGLRDEALLPGKCKTGGWYHDFVGSGSDEHHQLWLRYHASDEDRTEHARDWPEEPLPPKEKPVGNRDWRLPRGPF